MQKRLFIGILLLIMLLGNSCSIEDKYAPINEYANIDLSHVPFSTLSEYGFFSGDMNALNPVQGVYPYSLTSPSFADYSSKERFIYLPEGTYMEYQGDFNSLKFPIGTIIIKNFMYYNDIRDKSLGRKIIETRLLVKKETKWKPFSYKWNDEQTEAIRLIVGGTITASIIAHDGNLKEITNYVIPRELDCRTCHNLNEEMTPIGPKPANLNRSLEDDPSENQLDYFVEEGILSGMRIPHLTLSPEGKPILMLIVRTVIVKGARRMQMDYLLIGIMMKKEFILEFLKYQQIIMLLIYNMT